MSDKDEKLRPPPLTTEPPPKAGSALADLYTDSKIDLDAMTRERMREAAPEVSQGAWRERAFKPRGRLTAEEIAHDLREIVRFAVTWHEGLAEMATRLKREWIPLLQQAVEQVGGDGFDSKVGALVGKKKAGVDPFLGELIAALRALDTSPTQEELWLQADRIIALIEAAFAKPKKLSLKVLERELEGRLGVDEVLSILIATDDELQARGAKVRETLDTLREELRSGAPGAQPTGLLWNFTRVKAERILIDAELRARGY